MADLLVEASNDSKVLYSQEKILQILYHTFFFRFKFHGFSSIKNYFKEAEKRGLIKLEKNNIRVLIAN